MREQLLITASELESLRRSGDDVRIVDCRFDLLDPDAGLRLYEQAHIPAAVFADLDRDLSAPVTDTTGRHPLPDAGELAGTFGRLGIDRDTPVVTYDASGGALAARAWWLLRWLGHERVRLLDGGLGAWEALQLPLEPGRASVREKQFRAAPRPEKLVHLQELLDNGESAHGLNLIDAREAARFSGDAEPIDPVAGHIPGARNLPYTATLRPDGTFKSGPELRALWAGILGKDRDITAAVMCGSGVTACHLVISALAAGYREPRVFVGSWSEWITDALRPVATGPA